MRRIFLCLAFAAVLAALYGANAAQRATAQTNTVTFAVIGDYGVNTASAADVAALVASWDPDFVITTGDNYYNAAGGVGTAKYDLSTGAHYCAFLKDITTSGSLCPAGQASVNNFFLAMGNHDYSDATPGPDTYLEYFNLPGADFTNSSGNERYYDFVRGPVHFFVLNSNYQEPDGINSASVQAAWLQSQLALSMSSWNLIVFHHPPYSSSSHGNSVVMQWPFAAWGADAVLSGHDHTYERITHDSIPYFVNGLGGAGRYAFGDPVEGSTVRYNANWGAMRITASETSVLYEFFSLDGGGALQDTYSTSVLAVQLAEFSATRDGNDVRVDWQTASELDNRGFNLYRSAALQAPETRLNAALIPAAAPGSTAGQAYTWLDSGVAELCNPTCYYWLETVDLSGVNTWHGPVSAAAEPSAVTGVSLESATPAPLHLPLRAAWTALLSLAAGQRVCRSHWKQVSSIL